MIEAVSDFRIVKNAIKHIITNTQSLTICRYRLNVFDSVQRFSPLVKDNCYQTIHSAFCYMVLYQNGNIPMTRQTFCQ